MDRRGDFKFHGLTTDELRRRREETTVQLRQTRREEALHKRRFAPPPSTDNNNATVGIAGEGLAEMDDDFDADHAASRRDNGRIAELVSALMQTRDLPGILNAASGIRRLLSKEQNPPIQDVIDAGVIPRLVDLLKLAFAVSPVVYDPDQLTSDEQQSLKEKIVFESAWALTNVASGKTEQTNAVVQSDAPALFCQLLEHPNADICEQSIWALGNIAGDGPPHRDLLLSMGLAGKMQALLEREIGSPTPRMSLIRNATWTVSNLARGKPPARYDSLLPLLYLLILIIFCFSSYLIPPYTRRYDLLKPLLTTSSKLLQCSDSDTLSDAGWTLSYLTDSTNPHIFGDLQRLGMLPLMVQHLGYQPSSSLLICSPVHVYHGCRSRTVSIQAPFLRTVGNLVTGDDADTQAVLDCGLLGYLHYMLTTSTKANIQKECCWVVSNITAGPVGQVQVVFDANLVSSLIGFLRTGDLRTRREAVWALCNATSHHLEAPDQVR
jgi:importin subunit alpha-1